MGFSISAAISSLLSLSGMKKSDLVEPLELGSRQSLSNKFTNERWFGSDLIKVANLCGCKLAFVLPDGQQIMIDETDSKKK